MYESIFKQTGCGLPQRRLLSIVIAGAIGLAGGFGPVAHAQDTKPTGDDAAQASQAKTLEGVSVVGSRIRRKDETAANPVFTMERDEIEATGTTTVGELLQQLPSVGSSFNSTGSGGTSHGSASLNLRNMGNNRSLVLVNGRRWVNGAGTRGFRDFVDLNTIPLAAIERVEVLLDGATAIYGADAIAGVVNLVTYSNFDGLKASTYVGQTDKADGFTHDEEVLWGKSADWGSVLASASVRRSNQILAGDRAFSRVPLQGVSPDTPAGRFRNTTAVNGFGTRTFVPDGSGGFRLYNPATDVYNDHADTTLIGPLDLANAYGQLRLHLGERTTFVGEALFNTRKSSQRFSAVAPRIRGSDGMTIPADQPYNPFGVTFQGKGFEAVREIQEVGPRINTQNVNTTRLAVGLEGEVFSSWSWNAFYTYAQNKARWHSANQIDLDKVALALGPAARCLQYQCVPLNIFGPITPQMADYIRADGIDRNGTKQHDFTANVTGELFALPAGELAFATGVEYRKESGYDDPSPYFNQTPQFITYSRKTTSAPRLPTTGSYDVREAYVEFSVPLLANLPWARKLELSAATRYSDYSTFGSTTNSKLGLTWTPWDDLMLRTDWAQGFRAPSINELYAGLRQTNLPARDPCNGGGAGLPGCAGVPTSYDQKNYSGGSVLSTVGGNPGLRPETSVNRSVGFVYTPHFARGLAWSVDWYRIELKEAISSFGSQNLLDLCASSGQRCNLIQRAPSGEIVNLIDGPINLNQLKTSGVDTTLRYALPKNAAGNFAVMVTATYLERFNRYDTLPNGQVRVVTRAGKSDVARESFPRWKADTSLDWSRNQWSANWRMHYIGSTWEGVNPGFGRIPAQLVHDVWGAYRLRAQPVTLTLGVQNLFDKRPPLSWVNGGDNNFDMSTYDPRGRFIYVKAEVYL